MAFPLNMVPFLTAAVAAAEDAGSMIAAGASVVGNAGRYAGPAIFADARDALAFIQARRAAIRNALALLLFATTTPGTVATAMGWVLDAILAGASPADRLRVLAPLAGVTGDGTMSVCCRRLSLSRLALASAAYVPASYEDAQSVRTLVCGLLDAEILRTADAGQNTVYAAFRALRIAVSRDLSQRGGSLPRERQVTVPPLPAAVLAYKLYGDATRADELIARANPVNPLFMPASLTVLDR